MSTSEQIEVSTGHALFEPYRRFERVRRNTETRPRWRELEQAEQASVIIHVTLFAVVAAFVAGVALAAGMSN
jgi:hypothetical protein